MVNIYFNILTQLFRCIENMNFNYFLEDDSLLLNRYCPMANTNDKFTILSPMPMLKLLVIHWKFELNKNNE